MSDKLRQQVQNPFSLENFRFLDEAEGRKQEVASHIEKLLSNYVLGGSRQEAVICAAHHRKKGETTDDALRDSKIINLEIFPKIPYEIMSVARQNRNPDEVGWISSQNGVMIETMDTNGFTAPVPVLYIIYFGPQPLIMARYRTAD